MTKASVWQRSQVSTFWSKTMRTTISREKVRTITKLHALRLRPSS
ncbi:MAG: hypothetical protein R6X02_20075 [Enhygromyxa sp.]